MQKLSTTTENSLLNNQEVGNKNNFNQKTKLSNTIEAVLEENNLILHQIPKGSKSFFKAVSYGLFNSADFFENVQEKCKEYVLNISNLQKLQIFNSNPILLRDYSENPHFIGFEKINLCLISLLYKVRVILYSISQENYLNSLIINHKFEKSIEFLKVENHYDVIKKNEDESHKEIEIQKEPQSEFLKRVGDLQKLREESKLRGKHKKSLSDTIDLYFYNQIPQNNQDSNVFINQPQKDYLQLITPTNRQNLNQNINPFLKGNVENRNYPNSTTNIIQEKHQIFHAKTPTPFFESVNEDRKNIPKQIIVDENNFEDNEKAKNSMKSPIFYTNSHPPGITPPNKVFPSAKFNFNFDKENEGNKAINIDKPFKNLILDSLNPNDNDDELQRIISNNYNEIQQSMSKKPIILGESKTRYTGKLKFFDETNNYGFIIMDEDQSDIFVHYDDLLKANINKEFLRTIKTGNIIRFGFVCMTYIGKYRKSRKAVEIRLIP